MLFFGGSQRGPPVGQDWRIWNRESSIWPKLPDLEQGGIQKESFVAKPFSPLGGPSVSLQLARIGKSGAEKPLFG